MDRLNRKQAVVDAVLAAALAAATFAFLSYHLGVGFNRYDEGVHFYAAWVYSRGAIPFLDLHCIYPPGRFYIYAFLARFIGWEVLHFRYVMVVNSSVMSALVFLLASRISRRPYALLAWALSVVYFYEFISPDLMILVFFLCASHFRKPNIVKVFVAGLLIGVMTWCRQDFGFYACVAAPIPFLLQAVSRNGGRSLSRRLLAAAEGLGFLALGVVVFLAPWAILYLTVARKELVYSFIKAPILTSGLRALPYPMPWDGAAALLSGNIALSAYLKRSLLDIVPYSTPLALIGLSLVFLWNRRGRPGAFTCWDWTHVYVAAYALALFNYARVVSDLWHLVPMAIFASILASPLLMDTVRLFREGRRALPSLAAVVLVLVSASGTAIVAEKLHFLRVKGFFAEELGVPRARGIREAPELAESYRKVVNFIKHHTGPDEKIYVGLVRHDVVSINDIMLPFLAERELSTRYYHFDPGVQTTAPIQEEMIFEIKKYHVRYAVLWAFRPADKLIRKNLEMGGAHLLDDYLREHFAVEVQFGDYVILRRKPRPGPVHP